MAYTPHTWNNEVITDAKLNAIEQGVRTGTLLSGTDIDADKDWAGKAITNIGALQIRGNIDLMGAGTVQNPNIYALAAVSVSETGDATYLAGSDDAEETTMSGEYVKLKQFTIPVGVQNGSTVLTSFRLWNTGGVIINAYGRIYVNGAAVGTERGTPGTATFTESISVRGGDTVELWAKATIYENQVAHVDQYRIYAYELVGTTPRTINADSV